MMIKKKSIYKERSEVLTPIKGNWN